MPIRHSLNDGAVEVGDSTDTTIIAVGSNSRRQITAFTLHNTTAVTVNVDLYISDDDVSANGDHVERVALAANETRIAKTVGQTVRASHNLIASGDGAADSDVVALVTYSLFDGDS